MKVLVACEESQRVCTAFREKGHEAYSCDFQTCSGGHPEGHIMQDVIPLLDGRCNFKTMDGTEHLIDGKWDLIIAHPPCTYLTNAGTRHYTFKINPPEKVYARMALREEASDFFMKFVNADCDRICIENPVGYMNTKYRKPDQVVPPYWFAKDENICEGEKCKGKKIYWCEGSRGNKGGQASRAKARSKTFPAIAKAMAEQWGEIL